MSVDIQWTDTDPDTGDKRFVSVERFAGVWRIYVRAKRREEWGSPGVVSRDMWEVLLDALQRRYQRREGVTDVDLDFVRRELAKLPAEEGEAEEDE